MRNYEVIISNDKVKLYEKIVCQSFAYCYYRFQALSMYILFNARLMFHLQQLLKFEKNSSLKIRI